MIDEEIWLERFSPAFDMEACEYFSTLLIINGRDLYTAGLVILNHFCIGLARSNTVANDKLKKRNRKEENKQYYGPTSP